MDIDVSKLFKQAQATIGIQDAEPIPYIVSTGSYEIDKASGIGGIPGGRIIEVYGPESSGKTTLTMHILANAQSMDLPIAMIDNESAFDEDYAKRLGIKGQKNVDYIYGQPETTEQTLQFIEFLLQGGVKVIVVDSVAAMVPKAELEGDFGEAVMGLQARLMSQGLRKLTNMVSVQGAILIFINQIRHKIGVNFGSPETTTGGNALKFYATMRIDLRQVGDDIKQGDVQIGKFTRVTFKKNKVAPPMKKVMVPIRWGFGFWKAAELLDKLLTEGLICKKSSYFYYNEEVLGAGKAKAIAAIEEEIDYFEEILRRKHEPTENQES